MSSFWIMVDRVERAHSACHYMWSSAYSSAATYGAPSLAFVQIPLPSPVLLMRKQFGFLVTKSSAMWNLGYTCELPGVEM